MQNYKTNKELAEKEGFVPVFDTLAVTDAESGYKTADAQAAVPSQTQIQNAKDWVEHNEK